jgi:hypothetical protein
MQDVNGQEIRAGGLAMLLCEVLEVESHQVRIRVMNSEMELAVGAHFDEVLGQVADAELTAFIQDAPSSGQNGQEGDSLSISAFE